MPIRGTAVQQRDNADSIARLRSGMQDVYWYPSMKRVKDLELELDRLEAKAPPADDVDGVTASISETLLSLHRAQGMPRNQIGAWVRLASYYRPLRIVGDPAAAKILSAVDFLKARLPSQKDFSAEAIQDLNWVLSASIRTVHVASELRSSRLNLAAGEYEDIDRRLESFERADNCDFDQLRTKIASQMVGIKSLAGNSHYGKIAQKIDALFSVVDTQDFTKRRIAQGALLYLAKAHDTVSDELGILGFLDDLYVIDWAYAKVTGQTNWLPIVDGIMERWPFLLDLAFESWDGYEGLDKYSEYVSCAILDSLFRESESHSRNLLLLPETGPYPLIGALSAALGIRQSASKDSPVIEFSQDQPVLVGDEHIRLRLCTAVGILSFRASIGLQCRSRPRLRSMIIFSVPLFPRRNNMTSCATALNYSSGLRIITPAR